VRRMGRRPGHVNGARVRRRIGRPDPQQLVRGLDVDRRAQRGEHTRVTAAVTQRDVRPPADAADPHARILALLSWGPVMRSWVGAGCVLLIAGCAGGGTSVRNDAAETSVARDDGVETFIARHWRTPLPPQGPPPPRFTPLEASLAPEACGTCHPAQLADWRTS